MTTAKTQIGDVSYNAATQCFEALVTFHTNLGRVRIASTFLAPISTDFETAVKGLWQNALSSLDKPETLQARLQAPRSVPPRRAPQTFDLRAVAQAVQPRAA